MYSYVESDHRGTIQALLNGLIDDDKPVSIELARKGNIYSIAIRQGQDRVLDGEQQSPTRT